MMFEKKMIFSKRYPNILENFCDKKLTENCPNTGDYRKRTDFINNIENDSKFVPVPKRIKAKEPFIHLAEALSKNYEIDTDIYENEGGVTANLYIEPSVLSGELKILFTHLVLMADNISFFIPKDKKHLLLVRLDYFTHELYLSGKKLRNIR